VRFCIPLLLSAGILCAFPGCGSDVSLGEVSGTVTLDDQPLPDATVKFHPMRKGAPSAAVTDSTGKYTLQFTREKAGAVVGDHRVEITTFREENPDSEPPTARVAEKVPMKYNVQTELTAKVEDGTNTRDFALKSDGPIQQPDQVPEDDCGPP
jgi:hypothetical protein